MDSKCMGINLKTVNLSSPVTSFSFGKFAFLQSLLMFDTLAMVYLSRGSWGSCGADDSVKLAIVNYESRMMDPNCGFYSQNDQRFPILNN